MKNSGFSALIMPWHIDANTVYKSETGNYERGLHAVVLFWQQTYMQPSGIIPPPVFPGKH